jgi:hypothetical protein
MVGSRCPLSNRDRGHPVLLGFTATGDSALHATLSQNKKILTIVGKIIDEVKVLSQPLDVLQKDVTQQQNAKGHTSLEREPKHIENTGKMNDERAVNTELNHVPESNYLYCYNGMVPVLQIHRVSLR